MWAEKFVAKYGSAMKYWANAGFAGVVVGWLFMVELPALRKDAERREATTAEREDRRMKDYRDERRDGLKHAGESVELLGKTMRSVEEAVSNQTRTLVELQTVTHRNQQRIIDAQMGKSAAKVNE